MPEWISLGREVLAQLSAPVSLNFSDATKSSQLDAAVLTSSGGLYVQILEDLDSLVATDTAFLLGPWLEMASSKATAGANDCGAGPGYDIGTDCAKFYVRPGDFPSHSPV